MKKDKEEIYSRILKFAAKEGKVVTTSEIAAAFNFSWNTAEKYLLELVLEGKLNRIRKLGANLWVLK